MNNISVDLYIKPSLDSDFQRVELFDFEEVSLTSKIQDIRDIRKVFTDFSQEFVIPATKNNNKIFKHYNNWDILDGFDARIKADALIKLNGVNYKEGKITLKGSDLRNDSLYSYRAVFYGKTVNLKDLIGDDKLELLGTSSLYNDLDPYLDIFNFEYNSQTVKDGLNKGFVLNNGVIDINSDAGADSAGDLCFPFISSKSFYFYDSSDGDNPKDRVDSRNVYDAGASGNTPRGIFYKDLKPSIRVYHIIKAIERKYGIEFSDDFFNTSYKPFYDLHLLLHREKGDIEEQFEVPRAEVRLGDFTYTDINDPDYLDLRNQDNKNTVKQLIDYKAIIFAGFESVRWRFKYEVIADPLQEYSVYLKDRITDEYIDQGILSGIGTQTFDFYAYTSEVGEKVEPVLYIESDNTAQYSVDLQMEKQVRYQGFEVDSGRSEFQTITSGIVVENTFNLAAQLPKIKTIDFLTSLFKVFNLTAYYVPDFNLSNDAGKIKVRTLDSYYAYGKVNDITKYIDNSKATVNRDKLFSTIDFEFSKPSTFAIKNSNDLTYDEFGNERLNNTSKDINSPLAFDGGKYKVDNKFEKVQFERMSNQASEVITDIQWGWLANQDENAVLTKPLIYYPIKQVSSEGLLFDENKVGEEPSILPNNTYIRPSNALVDGTESINYGSEFDEWEVHDAPSSNEASLFNLYYRNYVLRSYDKQSRRLNVTAQLPLSVLTKLELNDTIRIKNKFFHINSLDLNLSKGEAKMELLNKGSSIQACNLELTTPMVRIIGVTDTSITVKLMGNPLINELKYDIYVNGALYLENQLTEEIEITGLTTDTDYEIVAVAKIECQDLIGDDDDAQFLMLEDGFYLLLQTGEKILLESGTITSARSTPQNTRTTLEILSLEEDLDLSTVTGGSQEYRGLYVSPDGTKVIATSYSGLEQFNRLVLTNANSLNGGLNFFDDGKWNAQPISVSASPDGVYGFNMRLGFDLYRRDLGTDLNFGTATNEVVFTPPTPFSTAAEYQRQIQFNPNGLEFYVGVLAPSSGLSTYTMTTPWDISTSTLSSSDAYPTGASFIYGFSFLSGGTKLLTVDDIGNAILYELTTPYRVSTAKPNPRTTTIIAPLGGMSISSEDFLYVINNQTLTKYSLQF